MGAAVVYFTIGALVAHLLPSRGQKIYVMALWVATHKADQEPSCTISEAYVQHHTLLKVVQNVAKPVAGSA